MTDVRKGQAPAELDRDAFGERFRQLFVDPNYAPERDALGRIEEIAWRNYSEGRKAPHVRKAGPGYADPEYELSVEWTEARARIDRAQQRWGEASTRTRALVICGSPRNDGTCPGEISK
ncbi:MAG: NADPH-dependent FMN reductase, partial [Caldimonas sp.]